MKQRQNMNELRDGAERVEIEWIDSNSRSEWHPEHEALSSAEQEEHTLCCSVGYVIHEDDTKVVIAQSFAAQPNGLRDVGATMTIPRIAIRDIKSLRR